MTDDSPDDDLIESMRDYAYRSGWLEGTLRPVRADLAEVLLLPDLPEEFRKRIETRISDIDRTLALIATARGDTEAE